MSKGIKREGDCWHGSMSSWPPKQNMSREEMAAAAREFMNALGTEPAQVMRIVEDAPGKITLNGRDISGWKGS